MFKCNWQKCPINRIAKFPRNNSKRRKRTEQKCHYTSKEYIQGKSRQSNKNNARNSQGDTDKRSQFSDFNTGKNITKSNKAKRCFILLARNKFQYESICFVYKFREMGIFFSHFLLDTNNQNLFVQIVA